MCLFRELQEVAQPGVHPNAGVSWDLEFMGTRSGISCVFTSHCCHSLILPLLIISGPTAGTTYFFIVNLAAATLFPSEHPTSDLTTSLLLVLAPILLLKPCLFLLNQLNCTPPAHLHLCQQLYLSITLLLSQYHSLSESAIWHLLYTSVSYNAHTCVIWHICDLLIPKYQWAPFVLLDWGPLNRRW